MNYAKINACDIANGEGVRVSLFVSGCRRKCPGCFNTDAQSFTFGYEYTQHTTEYIMGLLRPDYIAGITILGGEPLEPENIQWLRILARKIQDEYCKTKTVWVYTGNTFEEISERMKKDIILTKLLENVNVLVDGPYIEEERDITLKFRGSRNQRIIDLHKTFLEGEIVLHEM